MTTTITAADRAAAWNIRLLRPPPSDRPFAGCYQPLLADQRFLTWARLHDDLRLCFDLNFNSPRTLGPEMRFLALWIRQPPSPGSNPANPRPRCIYLEDPIGHPASRSFRATINTHIDVEGLGACEDDASTPTLDLTLVFHDPECWLLSWDLESHLIQGCATAINVLRNPISTYLPIPTASSFSTGPSATQSRNSPSYPPEKRARTDTSGSASPRKSSVRLVMPPDLDINVKKLYQGTCAVTRTNSSWPGSTMISGPGMQACHIVPKAMYRWFPSEDDDAPGELEQWNRTNSLANCILLDAFVHTVHDLRLLAVDGTSERVRLFAPIDTLLPRSNQKAALPRNVKPSRCALRWHYDMCVIENMCAILLDGEGGAKRQPWRDGPVLLQDAMEEAEVGPAECEVRPAPEAAEKEVPLFGGASGAVKRKHAVSESSSPSADEREEWWFTQHLHRRLNYEAQMRKGRDRMGRSVAPQEVQPVVEL